MFKLRSTLKFISCNFNHTIPKTLIAFKILYRKVQPENHGRNVVLALRYTKEMSLRTLKSAIAATDILIFLGHFC